MGFMDLEKVYYRVNRVEIRQVPRMYAVGGKLLNGIKSMHVRVKGGESDRFRINSGVRQGCIMFPWLFNVHIWMQ